MILLFSVVQNINSTTTTDLNSDLSKISDWVFRWKMNFNPDPNKQVAEKLTKLITHHYFLTKTSKSSFSQKHLGMVLDAKLDFNLHLTNVQSKVNKTIGLPCKLQNILPRRSLLFTNHS